MGVADMQRLIRDLGYEPMQRDNWYRPVKPTVATPVAA
jgi:2-iminoacetate synthase ThiH